MLGFLRVGSAPAVVAAGLSKTYGAVDAVHNATFEVARGEIFAVLGSQGAGKSTLIGMLCAAIPPTAGRATVAGHDVVDRPRTVRRRVGVVTGPEAVLTTVLTSPAPVLFLDEPASGLDSSRRVRVWHHLRRLQSEGATVVYTTESVTDAEQADRIAIIDDGRVVAVGTPAALRAAAPPVDRWGRRPAAPDDVFFHFTGRPLRPSGDELGAARRFMAAHLR